MGWRDIWFGVIGAFMIGGKSETRLRGGKIFAPPPSHSLSSLHCKSFILSSLKIVSHLSLSLTASLVSLYPPHLIHTFRYSPSPGIHNIQVFTGESQSHPLSAKSTPCQRGSRQMSSPPPPLVDDLHWREPVLRVLRVLRVESQY